MLPLFLPSARKCYAKCRANTSWSTAFRGHEKVFWLSVTLLEFLFKKKEKRRSLMWLHLKDSIYREKDRRERINIFHTVFFS